jgi:hypothetical protein
VCFFERLYVGLCAHDNGPMVTIRGTSFLTSWITTNFSMFLVMSTQALKGITDSIKSRPWQVNSHSASQEIHRVHKNTPSVLDLSQMSPVHSQVSHSFNMHFNIIRPLEQRLPNSIFSLGFLTKILCSFLISQVRPTYLGHLILLDWITCRFVQRPVTSS